MRFRLKIVFSTILLSLYITVIGKAKLHAEKILNFLESVMI